MLDTAEYSLRLEGTPVPLAPKALDLLVVLVERKGQLATKEELLQAVWPGTFVEENNLSVNISTLRKALGEGPAGQVFIETVPRRGYRFAAPVTELAEEPPPAPPPPDPAPPPKAEPPPARRPTIGRWLALAAAAVGIAAALAVLWSGKQIDKLAVLPFKAVDGPDELGFGLADATITRLARVPGVRVLPSHAVRRFDQPGQDPIDAARRLGADAVLDGTLQHSAGRTRLTVQLLRVADGKHLWADTFDQPSGDVFAIEDGLANALMAALNRRFTGAGKTPVRGTGNAEAHRLYLAARSHFLRGFRTRDEMQKTIDFAGQAIALDPAYAHAHVILSGAWSQLAVLGALPAREAMLKAKDAALRALQLDPALAEAHASLAMIHLYYDYDLPACERSWRKANELDPENDIALIARSDYYLATGNFDESLAGRKKLQEMAPLEPLWAADMSHPLYDAGRFEEALTWNRRALDLEPKFALARAGITRILRSMGRGPEAVEAALAMETAGAGELRTAFESGGVRAFDQARLARLLDRVKQGKPVSALAVALAYTDLGEKDRAVEWLEKAYEERSPNLILIKTWPPWKPLHGHAGFESLLTRLGLRP